MKHWIIGKRGALTPLSRPSLPMISRTIVLLFLFAATCFGQLDDTHGHEGHGHDGPPPQSLTLISLLISVTGVALVVGTLLAILWKPIDTAFRLSRFRQRWERPATRIAFAAGVILIAGAILFAVLHRQLDHDDHAAPSVGTGELRPMFGGEVTRAGRFAVEMVARRTGEVRLYVAPLEGEAFTAHDVKAEVSITKLIHDAQTTVVTNEVIPVKVDPTGTYFVALIPPPQERTVPLRLTLRVKQESLDLNFKLPVQD